MRTDELQVAAAVNLADSAFVRPHAVPKKGAEETSREDEFSKSPTPAQAQTQISVSLDSDKNVIYQFLDMRTGEVLQQIPPEEVLQVMRSIADLLRQSERKFEIRV